MQKSVLTRGRHWAAVFAYCNEDKENKILLSGVELSECDQCTTSKGRMSDLTRDQVMALEKRQTRLYRLSDLRCKPEMVRMPVRGTAVFQDGSLNSGKGLRD